MPSRARAREGGTGPPDHDRSVGSQTGRAGWQTSLSGPRTAAMADRYAEIEDEKAERIAAELG